MSAGRPLIKAMFIVLPLAFALSACETMEKLNPFAEKQTPLPGERKPLFPEGVPGVEFGAPPPQPTNSNIPITPAMSGPEDQREPARIEQQPQSQARAPQPLQSAPAPAKSKTGDSSDAWDGTR